MGKKTGQSQHARYFSYAIGFLSSLEIGCEFTTKDFAEGVTRVASRMDNYSTADKKKTWQNDTLRTLSDIVLPSGQKGLGILKQVRRGKYQLLSEEFNSGLSNKFNFLYLVFKGRKKKSLLGSKTKHFAKDDTSSLTKLGSQKTEYQLDEPSKNILETFENKYPVNSPTIRFEFKEWTSLCPKTGQPDFGEIVFDYVPDKLCIESKSVKLYFFSFRGQGMFMETIVGTICQDLVTTLSPKQLTVTGNFAPRGGIRIIVKSTYVKNQE